MSTNCCGADKVFDLKTAKKELKKYQKSGPGKPTRKLLELIGGEGLQGKSLLDIGGGIGAIQWHFLKNGGSNVTDVDYSKAYIEVAHEYAIEKGWAEKSQFVQGDFLEKADGIKKHDFVTLDKVVCCYPDYVSLLDNALSKSERAIGLVYPRDGFIADVVAFFGRVFLKLTGNNFRPYIHKVSDVRSFIAERGFVLDQSGSSFPWHVEVYRRAL